MASEKLQEATIKVTAILASLTPEERAELFDSIHSGMCLNCGLPQDNENLCQCWNDE